MTDMVTVKLMKGYCPMGGDKKLPAGTVVNLPAGEVGTLTEKGIAELKNCKPFTDERYFVGDVQERDLREKLEIDLGALVEYRVKKHSDYTRNAYDRDFKRFEEWCRENDETALPTTPETLCRYLLHRAREGRELGTLRRDATAISHVHELTRNGLIGSALVTRTFQYLRTEYYPARLEYEATLGGITASMAKSKLQRMKADRDAKQG